MVISQGGKKLNENLIESEPINYDLLKSLKCELKETFCDDSSDLKSEAKFGDLKFSNLINNLDRDTSFCSENTSHFSSNFNSPLLSSV